MSLALLPDSEPLSHAEASSTHKFPHTRAQLASFARQQKSSNDSHDSDADPIEDLNGVSSTLANKVIALLVDEREEELKKLLKETYSFDDQQVEQSVLDLLHKHRDDVSGVPFLFLTPTRRPISRPSSRASTHSARLYPARPETPVSAPSSPLAQVFRRPHTPLTSPLALSGAATSYMTARSDYSVSPSSSPILSHAHATQAHAQFTASLPASPLSSPRLLNAKAHEFKPIVRPLSAASSNPGPNRTETPSPDLWAHSPFRASSNLAIAAPLLPDQTSYTRSLTPSSLRSPLRHNGEDEDEDQDPFEVFGPKPFSAADFDTQWSNSNTSLSPDDIHYIDTHPSLNPHAIPFEVPDWNEFAYNEEANPMGSSEEDPENNGALTDGMTPFDVLSSVFGSTLAPSELEEALAENAYDFERAMQWLIERALPQVSPTANPLKMQQMGGRVTLVSRDLRGVNRGGYQNSGPGRTGPRYVNGKPVPGGNRVCRYFVAGECLRADCRFSHDLERALCRFWLRGACAKGEHCEFLHHLPKDVDISSLNMAMTRMNINHQNHPVMGPHNPPLDDFPVLGMDNDKSKRHPYNDPSRTRFAAAVKKPAPQTPSSLGLTSMTPGIMGSAARREAMGRTAMEDLHHRSAIVAPRSSPRLRLRPPSLLPTLPTGESVNKLYMTYRSRALQLGAARNACRLALQMPGVVATGQQPSGSVEKDMI
ncbi:hypothetical protein AAF712_012352 [Marasmius tenuissimus]|uniref:C3H1-type domain-containing protein n=1 Tax=Marasmius tenuissimus TaxID=585030 RepID=A0ABR2ZJG7_9AGAR